MKRTWEYALKYHRREYRRDFFNRDDHGEPSLSQQYRFERNGGQLINDRFSGVFLI